MDALIIFIISSLVVSTGMYVYLLGKQCKKNRNRVWFNFDNY